LDVTHSNEEAKSELRWDWTKAGSAPEAYIATSSASK